MLELLNKLTALRDMARAGSGRLADVLDKVEAVVAEAKAFARDVEAGKVFAPSPDDQHRLHALQADFEACCDEATGTPPVNVTAGDPAKAVPPEMWIAIARLVIEIIRKRRGG